jgi:predicted kinase
MALEVILTKGLPASGKSTWAKEQVRLNPDKYFRVNKDDLREMMFCSIWTKQKEKLVLHMRNEAIKKILSMDKSVIIDDTNLDPSHERTVREIVESNFPDREIQIKVKDFTDVSIDECLRRNSLRPNKVPDHVIHRMFEQYLAKKDTEVKKVDFVAGLPEAILVDLDGTLAINDGHRGWYDEDKVYHDKVNEKLVAILHPQVSKGIKLIFVSGRTDSCHTETLRFIREKAKLDGDLFMRKTGDKRKDSIVKKELYETHIKGKYNINAVFDDRLSVCRMWHSEGLPLFRVGDPDSDI